MLGSVSACGDDAAPRGPEPLFPADYAATYVEVRDCRSSTDHELSRVRVLADPASADAYRSRDGGFAAGDTFVKAEYDYSDTECQGEIQRWTVMVRLAEGSSPVTLDYAWQELDAQRNVVTEDDSRCIGCHTSCGVPPDGYLGTCTVP